MDKQQLILIEELTRRIRVLEISVKKLKAKLIESGIVLEEEI